MSNKPNDLFRAIPPVDDILDHATVAALRARHPRLPWTRLVRGVIDTFRASPPPLPSADRATVAEWILGAVERRVGELAGGGLRRVLNGTGVVLHTNLGRAVLSRAGADAAREAMMRYVSLEVDMDTGGRGPRGEVLQRLLCLATGAEACMVVNNNAAAVYLLVNTFSPPGRVIVSRGELVEIGGSFRLPEILRHAAAEVVEVGTTNRTYAEDYRKAARRDDLILKVHKSNYAIEGFAHEASVDELAAVAADTGCRLAYDLGSGALFDFRGVGLGEDPTVSDEVALGVDCVTMSGDKLLGGPQAGILAGRAELVARLKRNPLRRALRVDKVTIAALQHVLRQYLFAAEPAAELPSLGRILGDVERLRERALRIADGLGAGARAVSVVDDEGAVGGGSLTRIVLPSVAVAVVCADERDAVDTARRMRSHDPPLFPRVRGREVRINMIAIAPDEDTDVRRVLDATLVVRES